MSHIAGVHGVLAAHRYPQEVITAQFSKIVSPDGSKQGVIERIHQATGVEYRYLSLPLDSYQDLAGFGATNDVFIKVGLELGKEVISGALKKAGVSAVDVDLIIFTSVTGIAVPSLDSRLIPILNFRPDIKRIPSFGLGCIAGATGIARVHDFLLGNPDGVALLLSVELCSLTVQRDDLSMANIVASGLFGDGAAAVVMVGDAKAEKLGISGPKVIDSRSRVFEASADSIGWDINDSGFQIVLSAEVPKMVQSKLDEDVSKFLQDHDLKKSDISHWIVHPGGPKVVTAVSESLGITDPQLDVTWKSLAAKGNLSSASILHVLQDIFYDPSRTRPLAGEYGLMISMGPGFATELVLVGW